MVSLASGMALEADLPEVLVRSVTNPRSLLTFVCWGAFMTSLPRGPKVGGFQDPCDLGFPRRLRSRAKLADLFR